MKKKTENNRNKKAVKTAAVLGAGALLVYLGFKNQDKITALIRGKKEEGSASNTTTGESKTPAKNPPKKTPAKPNTVPNTVPKPPAPPVDPFANTIRYAYVDNASGDINVTLYKSIEKGSFWGYNGVGRLTYLSSGPLFLQIIHAHQWKKGYFLCVKKPSKNKHYLSKSAMVYCQSHRISKQLP
jgi:hypothetical protein